MEKAGGGVLVPGFLSDRVKTDAETDQWVTRCIREKYSFVPTMVFVPEEITESQLISWPALLEKIPELIRAQLAQTGCKDIAE